jgi:hypothetical protein
LNSVNKLMFVMVTGYVLFELRGKFLNTRITQTSFGFKGLVERKIKEKT